MGGPIREMISKMANIASFTFANAYHSIAAAGRAFSNGTTYEEHRTYTHTQSHTYISIISHSYPDVLTIIDIGSCWHMFGGESVLQVRHD